MEDAAASISTFTPRIARKTTTALWETTLSGCVEAGAVAEVEVVTGARVGALEVVAAMAAQWRLRRVPLAGVGLK